MFKNVLVGVDGSANGHDAVRLASRLTDTEGRLTLAHVRPGKLHPLHAITPGLLAEEHDASEQLLERELALAEVKADLVSIVSMSPGRGLHQHAEDLNADLLVVGACSHGAFGRAMLGDDTRATLNGAPCAVAIAARGYAEYPVPIGRIGVGYNGSRESEAALELALTLAAPTRATVEAVEAVSIPSYGFVNAGGEYLNLMLTEASNRMKELSGVDGRAVYGGAGEQLAALSNIVDLLVVGSSSYGSVLRLVLGSTCDYLERHARCSLLVLPRLAIHRTTDSERDAETASIAA
ncbi:MAG TPA: universal stress protein [Solirubrobacteraceae bacterium]|nr:universal stress protein [Solirubrobacteraceae bacterium]